MKRKQAFRTLAAVAGAQIAPQVPLVTLLAYSLMGAGCALTLLVVGAVLMANISQWVLSSGGTDVQWFWFGQEPPGLVQLRADLKAKQLAAHTDPGS